MLLKISLCEQFQIHASHVREVDLDHEPSNSSRSESKSAPSLGCVLTGTCLLRIAWYNWRTFLSLLLQFPWLKTSLKGACNGQFGGGVKIALNCCCSAWVWLEWQASLSTVLHKKNPDRLRIYQACVRIFVSSILGHSGIQCLVLKLGWHSARCSISR